MVFFKLFQFEIDFELKYPKQVHSLEVNWSNFKECLLSFTREKCKTDKNAVAVVKQNNINLNEEGKYFFNKMKLRHVI